MTSSGGGVGCEGSFGGGVLYNIGCCFYYCFWPLFLFISKAL